MSVAPFHVAIVGTGASGTLTAAQIGRMAPQGRVALIGNASRPGRGVAYDTVYHANLLNVPAGNMSAFPDDMGHFVNWLKRESPDANAATFATRIQYGNYLAEIFESTIGNSDRVEYINDAVNDILREGDLWMLRLKNNKTITSHSVVLAFGNLLPPADPIDFSAVSSVYRRNPWSADVAQELEKDAPVLLIGTGLTMVDVALSLREAGHCGPVHAISRHGRLYQFHRLYQAHPLPTLPSDFDSPLGALQWIRRQIIYIAEGGKSDWRAVIDSLRPHTATIWQRWNLAQRKSFLRHLRNLWDIHRHRMAPEIWEQINGLIQSGILTIHRGRLISASPNGQEATVGWIQADSGKPATLQVARIINCTGPSRDYSKAQSPLISQLRADGLIVPDSLHLGFETDADGRFIGADGNPVQGLFTLGPTRILALWESIAIPEIRNQAAKLARLLAAEVVPV
jgi:uncharacterized NAD(P)/FAD-binding protein YdhS